MSSLSLTTVTRFFIGFWRGPDQVRTVNERHRNALTAGGILQALRRGAYGFGMFLGTSATLESR